MRALSIRQPWAWLILRPDVTDPQERRELFDAGLIKPIENRDWSTAYRGRTLVHAGKAMTRKEWTDGLAFARGCGVPLDILEQGAAFDQLQRGGIVGAVDIVDCVEESDSAWFMGEFGFVLRNSTPLPFMPWKGQLGFFDVPLSALGAARAAAYAEGGAA